MKKKISLMLAAALTAGLALTGCGGSKTSDTTDNTAGAESESTAETKGVDVDTTGYLIAAWRKHKHSKPPAGPDGQC